MEGSETIDRFLESLKRQSEAMMEALRPPTEMELAGKLSIMSDNEVEGIANWGSKLGRRLAKIEMKKRRPAPETFLKKISNLFK